MYPDYYFPNFTQEQRDLNEYHTRPFLQQSSLTLFFADFSEQIIVSIRYGRVSCVTETRNSSR